VHSSASVNIFSSSEFLEVMGEVFFPHGRRSIELRRVEGRVLRLLVVDGEVVRSAPFYDFPQPLEGVPSGTLEELTYFPRTVLRTTELQPFGENLPGLQPSPYVDWSRFADAAAFEQHLEKSGANLADSRRQRRRLEQSLGPVQFTFDDAREEVFSACLSWKSAQYAASGYQDLFAHEANVALFRELRRRKLVVINSLTAGDQLLAAHLGGVHNARFAWWVPAYDPAYAKYSPGRLLLESALDASQARGDLEFDFLLGNERYKFLYATHNRVIGALGEPPRLERWAHEARLLAKQTLKERPRLKKLVDDLRARASRAAHSIRA
jgi:Acetyltransferase (GNAT) domain